MPITWRNVDNNTGHYVAGQLLNNAGDRFDSAFDSLRGMLNTAQSTQEANRDNQIANNTAAYFDRLNALRNPDDLAAAQAELAAMRQGYGNMIDREATRGAFDSRLTNLYQQTNAANTFEDTQLNRQVAPIESQYRTLIQNGQTEAAEQLRTEKADLLNRTGLNDDLVEFKNTYLDQKEDRAFTTGQRDRTRQEWQRSDNERVRREGIDASITQALTDIDSVAAKGDGLGLSVAEAKQTVLSNLGVENLSGADRQYALAALDSALRPYTEQEALDVATDAQEDAQLATKYDIPNNLYAQNDPADVVNSVTEFLEKQPIENDLNDANEIDGAYLTNLLTNGIQIKDKTYDITPAMLRTLRKDRSFLGFSDAWDISDLESALAKLVTSPGVINQQEAYEKYKKESSDLATKRLKRNVFRKDK